MRLSGWIFMIISWTFILSLAMFCFSRIFKKGLGGEDEKIVQGKNKERRIGQC
jgi:choline-glycine betaine transporter